MGTRQPRCAPSSRKITQAMPHSCPVGSRRPRPRPSVKSTRRQNRGAGGGDEILLVEERDGRALSEQEVAQKAAAQPGGDGEKDDADQVELHL
jgi:hypothetical protein